MKLLYQQNKIIYNSNLLLFKCLISGIYYKISHSKKYYPNFDRWYFNNVIPSILIGDKEFVFEIKNEKIVGVAIIKHSEKKLCHLSIFNEYRNRGYGLSLFEKVFEKLDTKKPYLTVSEEKYVEFKKLFDYYGFKLSYIQIGAYRKNKIEYFFNKKETNV